MENNNKKGNGPKIVAAISLVLILILLFLSKTIYNYNLPLVTGTSPFKGKLNKVEITTGIVAYDATAELYSQISGKIDSILVREGDEVKKGQPIFNLSFEGADDETVKQMNSYTDEYQKKLDDLRISREKLNIDIEKINLNIRNTQRKKDELMQEIYKADDVSDYEILQCEKDIAKAEADLENQRALYDVGAVARSEIESAERNLRSLTDKYDNLQKTRNENLAKNAENTSDKESNRQKQLKDYEYQLESYEQELAVKRLDFSANSMQESVYKKEYESKMADYNDKLSDYDENAVIYAPEDSIVSKVYVNQGQYINANQQLAAFGLTNAYVVECEISLSNNFVMVGDTCNLGNSDHSMKGTVTKVVPTEHVKTVTISVQEEGVAAGETFEILFEKKSSETYTLVPNGAVNKDSEGYFLSQIKRRDGILGKEFYTEKLRVYIGDSDSDNTVILKGVGFFEPIALVSDKTFDDGDTIKLKNESDFFEE